MDLKKISNASHSSMSYTIKNTIYKCLNNGKSIPRKGDPVLRKITAKKYRDRPEIKEKNKEYHAQEHVYNQKKIYRSQDNIKQRNNKWIREKRRQDISYKLKHNIRDRIRRLLNQKKITTSFEVDIGCSIEFLKTYLESKFKDGMEWGNWGPRGWHIDHIRPLSSFNLSDKKQYLEACNYKNLQPLWAKENMKKHCKWESQ